MDDDTPAQARRRRRAALAARAAAQNAVLSRTDLVDVGLTRSGVRAEVRAGRLVPTGGRTFRLGSSEPDDIDLARRMRAVLEVCPSATLDGISLLRHAGLRTVTGDGLTHVSAPKSSRPRRVPGVRVHETRRWSPDDRDLAPGLRRVRVPVAAIRAALWARSDREAALMVVAPVQQRLVPVRDLVAELERVRRHARRRLLAGILADVDGGAHSLGELDFARLCRRRGLPEPSRQVRRRRRDGTRYLDVAWKEWGVLAEIDGVHHLDVLPWVDDALRQNALTGGRERMLRLPNLGLRLMPERFLDQVEQALREAGCPLPLRPNDRSL